MPCIGEETENAIEEEKSSSSGCFIATAAYGSEEAPVVQRYIYFRDHYLLNTALGRTFVSLYYQYSPGVAAVVAQHDVLRSVIRTVLSPVTALMLISLLVGGAVLVRSRD